MKCESSDRPDARCQMIYWAQSTVSFPTGGHVNVLSDYKETVPEKINKFLHRHCSHVTDLLIKFRQPHIKMHACALPVNIDQILQVCFM